MRQTNSPEAVVDIVRDLPGASTDPGICRATARRELAGQLDTAMIDDVVLVVSELVANAVLHGEPPLTFHLSFVDDHVLVAVDDQASEIGFDAVRRSPAEVRGRGLSIVEQVADAWGIDASPGGKTVWARFDGPPARRPSSRIDHGRD